jgi:hypothetical protein
MVATRSRIGSEESATKGEEDEPKQSPQERTS